LTIRLSQLMSRMKIVSLTMIAYAMIEFKWNTIIVIEFHLIIEVIIRYLVLTRDKLVLNNKASDCPII
jgi:hypothetical protein